MRATKALLVLVLGVGFSTAARAEEAPAAGAASLSGETLYRERTCIACHGADARTPILPDYPKLAGQNSAYLLRQAQDIKTGARANGNTIAMKGVMHIVNDDELRAISDWLASLD
jgi:cytochrome c